MQLVRQVLTAHELWRLKGLKADVVILNEHPASYRDEMHAAAHAARRRRAVGRLEGDSRAACSCSRATRCRRPRRSSSAPSPGRFCPETAATCGSSSTARRPSPRSRRPACRSARPTIRPVRTSGRPDADPQPPPLVMENGLGGFTRDGREYVVVLEGDRETPAALGQRPREPALRDHRHHLRGRPHLVREQPREPAHPVRQRPGHRPDRRGDLHPRRGERGALGRDAGAAPADRPLAALGGSPRRGRDAIRPRRARHRAGARGLRGPGRAGEAVAPDADEPLRQAAAPRPLLVQRVVARPAEAGRPAVRRDGARRRDRRGPGAQPCNEPVPGARRLRRRERARRLRHRRPPGVPRPQRLARPRRRARPAAAARTASAPASTRARRCRRSSSSRPARRGASSSSSGRGVTPRRPARSCGGSRAPAASRRPTAELAAVEASWDETLGRRPRLDPRRLLRPPRQPVAPLPGPREPPLGALRLLPVERRVRIPRPAPGRPRAHCSRGRTSRASTSSGPPRASSWRGTCSTGGTPRAARASGPAARTTCCGSRTRSPQYVGATGDRAVLDERIPFLEGPAVPPGEPEAFGIPAVSGETGTLFEHGAPGHRSRPDHRRARPAAHRELRLERRLQPRRPRGTRRERLRRLVPPRRPRRVRAPVRRAGRRAPGGALPRRARAAGDDARAELGRRVVPARVLRRRHAARVLPERRGEDRLGGPELGRPLRRGARKRAERAMDAVRAHLVRRGSGVVLLLTPPFDRTTLDPGYIKGYIPGIRENGGQYTHAARGSSSRSRGSGAATRRWSSSTCSTPSTTRGPRARSRST